MRILFTSTGEALGGCSGPALPQRRSLPRTTCTHLTARLLFHAVLPLPTHCRHVILPPNIAQMVPKGRLLSEVGGCCRGRLDSSTRMWFASNLSTRLLRCGASCHRPLGDLESLQPEWRALGVQQSRGWGEWVLASVVKLGAAAVRLLMLMLQHRWLGWLSWCCQAVC